MPCMYLERAASSPSLGATLTALQLTTARTPAKKDGCSVRFCVMSAATSSSLPPGAVARPASRPRALSVSRTSARTTTPASSSLATTRLPTPPVAPVTSTTPSTGTGMTGLSGSLGEGVVAGVVVGMATGAGASLAAATPSVLARPSTRPCSPLAREPCEKKATVPTKRPTSHGSRPPPLFPSALTDTTGFRTFLARSPAGWETVR
mmetsp:Transcript_24479/g.62205  ORF Transcript_24479/g.62205 Transcript_24479/m.62205 type:complete len:206 (+) Transcript_24479:1450-2067(+)